MTCPAPAPVLTGENPNDAGGLDGFADENPRVLSANACEQKRESLPLLTFLEKSKRDGIMDSLSRRGGLKKQLRNGMHP